MRLRSSILIEEDGKRLVVDCGPDFRQQMLRENIKSIDAILVTHGHKDHLGGLDDVRAFNYILKKPADVYATTPVQRMIRRDFSYAFGADKYPGVPEINLHKIINRPFEVSGLKVIPIRLRHFNNQFVYGFRIGNFTYITDAIEIPEKEMKKIRGSKVIVLNALRKKVHYSHFNLEQAVAVLKDLEPERGYLTHTSHQMGTYREVSTELPGFIELAYDGLVVRL